MYSLEVLNSARPEIIASESNDNNDFVIRNPKTDEYIEFKNWKVNGDKHTFDAYLSNGKSYESISLTVFDQNVHDQFGQVNSVDSNPAPVYIGIGLRLLDEIVSFFSDDAASICAEAAEICGDIGVKSVTYDEGGWFTEPSCIVECQDK